MAKGAAPKVQKLEPAQIEQVQDAVFSWLSERVQALSTEESSFLLVDVALEKEAGYWYLRVYIDKPSFDIALSDCEVLSRKLDGDIETFVDSLPAMKDFQYNLEVSSPGLFRTLKRPHEFQHYQGRALKIEFTDTEKEIQGTLKSYNPETKEIYLEEHPEPIQQSASPCSVTLNATLRFGDEQDKEQTAVSQGNVTELNRRK